MHTHTQVVAADGRRWSSEAVLFEQAQAGCRACLNQLMVRRQRLGQLPFAAAIQAGRIGLWRAILGYDPRRGYAFSTYAYPAIARHVWQAVKQSERAEPLPVVMDAAPMIERTDPAVIWEAALVRASLY